MNSIVIAEYKNIISVDRKPFGHGQKVLIESAILASKVGLNVNIACCKEFQSESTACFEAQVLKFAIPVEKYNYHSLIRVFSNIRCILNKSKANVIWFTNIDWFLLLFLGLYHTRKRIVVTVYRDVFKEIDEIGRGRGFLGKIIRRIVSRGASKINYAIKTFTDDIAFCGKSAFMPDYIFYDYYLKYNNKDKNNSVLCVGTMNSSDKDLFGLVSSFNYAHIPLRIIGRFVNPNDYEEAVKMKTDNVHVEDKYLSKNEYYKIIGKYKYVILPYKMEKYGSSTSGVLREALYVGATVIAPQTLLSGMSLQGIGYTRIEDVPNLLYKDKEIVNDLSPYKESSVIRSLKKVFSDVF